MSGSEPPRAGTLVFVYGPPASGKLTVAEELASRTGFRLLHNHATIDAVTPLFDFGEPRFFRLVRQLRLALVEAAAEAGLNVAVTYAYASPHDDDVVEEYVDLYERRGGRVLFVQLEAPDEELLRRVGSPSRGEHGKLTDADALRDFITRYDFRTPVPFEPNLTVDTTLLSPSEAAALIVERYGLGSPS